MFSFSIQNNALNACTKKISLINDMRSVWEQHVWWTREFIISVAANLNDLEPVTARLIKNATDMAEIFGQYYPVEIKNTIEQLITEHLTVAAQLVKALKAGDSAAANAANLKWYKNADAIAAAFAAFNPYYSEEEVRRMFYEHLDLTKKEAGFRLAGNFVMDIQTFDAIEREALAMADYFAKGIIKQFPNRFE